MIRRKSGLKIRGFTLIEAVITMFIISIIGVMIASILISLTYTVIYVPRQIEARNLAQDVVDDIVEGDPSWSWGIRSLHTWSGMFQPSGGVQDNSALSYFRGTFGYPQRTMAIQGRALEGDSISGSVMTYYRKRRMSLNPWTKIPSTGWSDKRLPYYKNRFVGVNVIYNVRGSPYQVTNGIYCSEVNFPQADHRDSLITVTATADIARNMPNIYREIFLTPYTLYSWAGSFVAQTTVEVKRYDW